MKHNTCEKIIREHTHGMPGSIYFMNDGIFILPNYIIRDDVWNKILQMIEEGYFDDIVNE